MIFIENNFNILQKITNKMVTIQIKPSDSLIAMSTKYNVDIEKYMNISLENDVNEATNEFCFKKDGKHMKTADAIITRKTPQDEIEVCLIKRNRGPYKDAWCLPGGFRDTKKIDDETTEEETYEETCYREGNEETNIDLRTHAVKIHDLGEVCATYNWDIRFSSPVSIGGFHFEVPYEVTCKGGDDALVAKWIKLAEIEDGKIHLGFSHSYWLANAFPSNKKFQILTFASMENIQGLKKLVNDVRKTKGRKEIPA